MLNPLQSTLREMLQMMEETHAGVMVANDGAGEEMIHPSWCMVIVRGEDAEQLRAWADQLQGEWQSEEE